MIPAFNEADRIGSTVKALIEAEICDEVLVVDDGSSDDTAVRAEEFGARVLRLEHNRGKGAALNHGLAHIEAGIVLLLDADLGVTSAQAAGLVQPVLNGEADMTIARFPIIPGRGGGSGLVVRLARWGILRATGRPVRAPLSGQRAIRRDVLDKVGGFERGFGAEVALTIDALRAGFRVEEIETTMDHRVTGRDLKSALHRGKQFAAVARALWRRRRAIISGPR